MIHPHTELRKVSDHVGYGVFATRRIPRGTVTWALDPLDQVLDDRSTAELATLFGSTLVDYTWVNASGKRILCWDFGRFMNHSCEANSYGPGGAEFEIAVRDIEVGEELTSDYGTLNLEEPLVCRCGRPSCRGVIDSEYLDTLAPSCDELIRAAFPFVGRVEQPLWRWLANEKDSIEQMIDEPLRIPSVTEHRFWFRSPGAVMAKAGP